MTIGVTAAAWTVVFTRAIPDRSGDRGVFASMAERLAAGDTLYVDVWDNKEPFFYETLALGRLISPFMDVVIELGWLTASSVALWSLARAIGASQKSAFLVAFALAPLILTGAAYLPGFSHLPPTTLLLVTCALMVRRRYVLAGMAAAAIVFFKVVMLPIAVVVIVLALLGQRGKRSAVRVAAGAAFSLAAGFGLLVIRGEFRGFIDLLVSNIGYSQSSQTAQVASPYAVPVWSHLEPVFGASAIVVLAATIATLALVHLTSGGSVAFRVTWRMATGALAAALGVLAVTGLWAHHAQVLYGPAALALVVAASASGLRSHRKMTRGVLLLSLTVLLAGGFSLRSAVDTGLSAPGRLAALTRLSQPAQDLLAVARSGAYQRLGKNTDDTHAQGLRAFRLGCYQFVQYTYDLPSTLDYIPGCLPTVDYVLVDRGFVTEPNADDWNRFVARSESVLARDFDCVTKPWGRLCLKRPGGAAGT